MSGQITVTPDDVERLGGIAGELEHLPAEIRRHFDQDGRDARFLRLLQDRLRDALDHPQPAPEGEDGERLYYLLALFDRRDGSVLAELVQRAREGYERSHPDMGESENRHAWEAFDALWDSFTMVERLRLQFAVRAPDTEEGT